MSGEPMTEREAALAARVKELEGAQANSAVTTAQGSVFESVWRTVTYIVPPWLAAVALAVFIAHYAFASYLQIQVTAVETQLKQAKADLETAKAEAANARDTEGVPMRLATLQAQTNKTTAEAAVARASANALNAQVNGETAALASAKAQRDNIQNQARVAQLKADAAGAKFGLSTLRDREVKANLIIQKLKTIDQQSKSAGSAVIASGDIRLSRMAIAGIRAECENNEYAGLIGCPAQFIRRDPQVATTTSDDNGQFWKVPVSCLPEWKYFNRREIHGVFAVTKTGHACGWSWNANKPIETKRREAMAACAKLGADCKIIGEK
jgi:hypothetical protein